MSFHLGRALFIFASIILGGLLFRLLIGSIMNGAPVRALVFVLIASPLFMLAAWAIQGFYPRNFSWTHISFAAVYGDLFVLTTATVLLACAWKKYASQISSFWTSPIWMFFAFIAAMFCGMMVHVSGGRSDSASSIPSERLHDSATSWAHNLGVWPAILGALIFSLVPLLVSRITLNAGIGVVLILSAWMALVYMDSVRAKLPVDHTWHLNLQWLDSETSPWAQRD